MIKGINAVLINTNQFEKMVDYYKDVIGVPLSIENHGGGKHAEIEYGEMHFSIMQGGPSIIKNGGMSISFHVDNVTKEYERIKKKGISIQEPETLPFGGIISTLKDPDGNGVILMMWQSEA